LIISIKLFLFFKDKKVFCLSIVLLGFILNPNAQFKHALDTIRYDLNKKKSFFLSLDGKRSFINSVPQNFFGLQAGYTFNKRTNIFVGLYSTYYDRPYILENLTSKSGRLDSNTVFGLNGLTYFNCGMEYYFYHQKKWRLALPISVGIGSALEKKYTQSNIIIDRQNFTMPVEIAFYATYKLKWWVWLGAGVGTRVNVFAARYSAPFYSYGVNIRFGEIYKRSLKVVTKKNLR